MGHSLFVGCGLGLGSKVGFGARQDENDNGKLRLAPVEYQLNGL